MRNKEKKSSLKEREGEREKPSKRVRSKERFETLVRQGKKSVALASLFLHVFVLQNLAKTSLILCSKRLKNHTRWFGGKP